jgi:hypothetical protein
MKRTGFILFFVLAFAMAAQGAKVNMNAAKTAAANWAYLQARASSGGNKGFCASYGSSVTNIFETKVTTNVSYYVANLSQGGTVILSGDTEMEPVIGFSSGVVTNVSAGGCNVLKVLLERDMKLRLHQKEVAENLAEHSSAISTKGVSSGTGMVAASGAGSAAGVTVVNKVAAAKWAALGVTVLAEHSSDISANGGVAASGDGSAVVKARALGEVTANGANEVSNSVEVVSDVRVSPIMSTKWDQGDDVYNYYVRRRLDPDEEYSCNQWACGCGATALAQVMKSFEWPKEQTMAQYLQTEYTCTVVTNGVASEVALTLVPGRYEWENMPDVADANSSDSVKTAIGKLTYNAAVAMRSKFYPKDWATSSTSVGECRALTESFGYAQARLYACWDESEVASGAGLHDTALRERVLYTNLDARRPVLLSIYTGEGAGHAVVADGYGFEGMMTEDGYENVAYVHLNLGWSGKCDLWYNIPEVDVGAYDFVYLEAATFNIAPEAADAGEIVSGRVRDGNDSVVGGATVNVEAYTEDWELVGKATTGNYNEIYALTVPEGGTYRLYMYQANGSIVAEQEIVVTNTVQDKTVGYISESADVGNLWLGKSYVKMQEGTVQVGDGKKFRDLSSALGYANRAGLGEVVISGAAELTRSVTLTGDMKVYVADGVDAAKCVVTRAEGATIKVANGAVLTVSDLVVASDATGEAVIEVEDGGTLDVQGGKIGLGRVMLGEGARFVTTWTGTEWEYMEGGIVLDVDGAADGVAAANWTMVGNGLTAEEATEKVTAQVMNYTNRRLGGEVQEDGTVVWRTDIAAIANAMVYMVYEGATETNYYATVDELIGDVTNNATIYFKKDCAADFYTLPLVITNEVTICSDEEDGSVKKVCPGGDACITIKEGGVLTIKDVTFTGYKGPRLFLVEGGEMILESGATLQNLASANAIDRYGVTKVDGGTLTMKSGAVIRECYARASSGLGCYGGGVAVVNGTLNLMGGAIRGCSAYDYKSTYGNDVYRTSAAKILVSGKVRVDDMYVDGIVNNPIRVVGELTGAGIGISASKNVSCKAGKVFAVVDAELTEGQLTKTAGKFYCHTVSSLYAVKGEADGVTNFVWAAMEQDNSVKPEYAVAEVVYEDGTELYYRSVDEALTNLHANATVIVLKDAEFSMAHKIGYDVVMTSTNEDSIAVLKRMDAEAQICVTTNASLTVTNLTLHGGGTILVNDYPDTNEKTSLLGTVPLLYVDGGELNLQAGTTISNVIGAVTGKRSAGAVTIASDGVLTMESGVVIMNCCNAYKGQKAVSGLDDSEGAGVYVENGTAYLRGGTIVQNWAWKASGIGVSSSNAVAYVSGDFTVKENSDQADPLYSVRTYMIVDDNTLYTNLYLRSYYYALGEKVTTNYCNMGMFGQAQLYLADELTGVVGITTYEPAQSNVFGKVENWAEWDFGTLTNSAAHFKNDITYAPGVVMTNVNETTALLVWSTALVNTNLTDSVTITNEEGEAVTYYPLAIPEEAYNLPVPVPTPEPEPDPDPEPGTVEVVCQAFKFTAIEEAEGGGWTLSLNPGTEYCTYKLYSFTDLADLSNLDNLTPVTTVTLTADDIDADGTFTFAGVYDGTVRYWMVRGENGTKPAEATGD